MTHLRLLVLAGLLCSIQALAQVNKSNLTGVVRDTSGAAVPGVSVTLTNTGTGSIRRETTDNDGLYRFTLVDFGVHRIEAERAGFKKFSRGNILLETGETVTVDIPLAVGDVSESVNVVAESPLLRTETGSLGTTITSQAINDLPIVGRNPYMFLVLSPAIQNTGSPTSNTPSDVFGPADFSASGSESRAEFLLDGVPNMRIDAPTMSPSPDSVQEMRLQTNAYDAEYGHSGSAFVNVSTKAGSNSPHGTLYWYHRNDNLNANSFFNNRNGQPKSENKWNTYGFALGAPLIIPKLYEGRDKTHFFVNYEGLKIRSGSFSRAVVPTLLERTGDFSQTTDRVGRPFTIYDPATTVPSGSGFVRSPFPGNVIPPSRLDPVALKALNYYPVPNRAPTPENQENWESQRSTGRDWTSYTIRADHQISSSQNLFIRYGWTHRFDPSTPFYGPCCRPAGHPDASQDLFDRYGHSAAIGHTWVQSSRTVVDFRLGFVRFFDANILFGEEFDLKTLGFPDSFAQAVDFTTFPRFDMSGDVRSLGPGRTSSRTTINQYNPLVNLHTFAGRHALKTGFRYQIAQKNDFAPGRPGGFFRFDRTFTQGPDPTRTSLNSGHDLASFLVGTPSSGYTDLNVSPALQNTYFAFYVHDDWKTTNRLTLNLGIRFEHEGPTTDRSDRGTAGFDGQAGNPLEAAAQANYARNPIPEVPSLNVDGGLRYLAVGDTPRGHLKMPALLYAPRAGFAYRLRDSLVLRGGYGIFYAPNNVSNYRQDGFSLATQMITSLDSNLTPFNRLSNPFPNGLVQPPGSAAGLLSGVGQSLTSGLASGENYLPVFRHPLSQQFSLGLQYVLPGQVSIETSYVGNATQRITINNRSVNEIPDDALTLKTRLNARVPNPFFGVITDKTSVLSQPTTTVAQLLRPHPEFLNLVQTGLPLGSAGYHSLQVQVSKRTSSGLLLGGAYTFSKLMEAQSFLNPNDTSPEHVISNSDRTHRLVLHGSYELPFGAGKPLLSSANGFWNRIAGGWQVSWIGTFQVGQPLEFADAGVSNSGNLSSVSSTPVAIDLIRSGTERIGRSDNNPHTVDRWFDITQFVPREPFTVRAMSSRLSDLRAPGINKWDITAIKNIVIREGLSLRLQAEFYNALNRTHFAVPNTTVTSANFGRITGTYIGPREVQVSARVTF